MRSDKNSTCMANRQRQSIITHNGSEMIRPMFSRFTSVLQIAFSKKPPNVVRASPPSCFRYTVLEAKEIRKFRETALKAHKE